MLFSPIFQSVCFDFSAQWHWRQSFFVKTDNENTSSYSLQHQRSYSGPGHQSVGITSEKIHKNRKILLELPCLFRNNFQVCLVSHYGDVIMGAIASQITSLTLFTQPFIQTQIKEIKLRVTGLCAGNSPGTCEFPAQMANNAENVSIWWRHHVFAQHSILIQTHMYFE